MASKLRFSLFRSTGFVAVLLIGLVLIVQYAGSWYWLEIMSISKENELEKHLEDLGRAGEPFLREDVLEMAEAAYDVSQEAGADSSFDISGDSPSAARYASRVEAIPRSPFVDFAQRARLKNLTILDETGRVLLSTAKSEQPYAPYDFLNLDLDAFAKARAGRPAGSIAYEAESSSNKRVYVPVFNAGENTVVGVLCLTAGRDYLAELDRLRDAARLLSSASTILVLMIGGLVYRLLLRQREYERRAAHADRLNSLGSLAAGFAHEVRNPLEIIGASAEDLERTLSHSAPASPEALEACKDILEEVERMNGLIGQFLQYSKADPAEGSHGEAVVRSGLDSALAMLRRTAENRSVALDASAAEPDTDIFVLISPGAFRQIVVNLVMNGIQASRPGGRIEIQVETGIHQVRLRFLDQGPGVPAPLRSRIFEPFFTTRDQGTGLGLAIAHQLATNCGGRLEYTPRAGGGACFELTLPKASPNFMRPMNPMRPISPMIPERPLTPKP